MSKKKNKKKWKPQHSLGYSTQHQVKSPKDKEFHPFSEEEEEEGCIWMLLKIIVISIAVLAGVLELLPSGEGGVSKAINYIKDADNIIATVFVIFFVCSVAYLLYKSFAESISDWLGERFVFFNKIKRKHSNKTYAFIKKSWGLIVISIVLMVVVGAYLAFGTEGVHIAIEYLKKIALAILYLPFGILAISIPCYLIYLFFKSRPKSDNWVDCGLYILVYVIVMSTVNFFIIEKCKFDSNLKIFLVSVISIASFVFLSKSLKCLITEKKGCFGWGCTIYLLIFILSFIGAFISLAMKELAK